MKSLIIEDSWILWHHKPPLDTTEFFRSMAQYPRGDKLGTNPTRNVSFIPERDKDRIIKADLCTSRLGLDFALP